MKTRSQAKNENLTGYSLNFHIFISPEYNIDRNSCEIGIYSNYNDWSPIKMHKLEIIRPHKDGYIAQGIVKFLKKNLIEYKISRRLEYKYILKNNKENGESEYFPEFLGGTSVNREFYFDFSTLENGKHLIISP